MEPQNVYKVELHAHTDETSLCGHVPAAGQVELYLKGGYQCLVLTDHYFPDFFTKFYPGKSWDEYADMLLAGYRAAKKAAEGTALTVLLGFELRSYEGMEDFLCYGMTEEDVYRYPMICQKSVKDMCDFAHEKGWLINQAHPYRDDYAQLHPVKDPSLIDAVEGYNGTPYVHNHNELALEWARKHHVPALSGSDAHREYGACRGGIAFPYPIYSSQELIKGIKKQDYTLLRTQDEMQY